MVANVLNSNFIQHYLLYLYNTDIADHYIVHFNLKPELLTLHRQNDTFTVVAKNKPAVLEV